MLQTFFQRRVAALLPEATLFQRALDALPMSSTQVRRHQQVAIEQGTGSLLVVLTGWLGHSVARHDGTRRITSMMLPGDFRYGRAESASRYGEMRVALTACEIGRIDPESMANLIAKFPAAHDLLWRAHAIEEATMRRWMARTNDAYSAAAHLLCEIHERLLGYGAVGPDQVIPLPLTQEYIADILNLTAVHVNRIMRRLREDGLIAASRGSVKILDLAGLRRAGGFHPLFAPGG